MYSEFIRRKRQRRLPEDSGEWYPIPLKFKHLPKPCMDWGQRGEPAAFNRLHITACLLPLIQLLIGSAIFWASIGTNVSIEWILITPVVIGFFTATVAAFHAMAQHDHRMTTLLAAMIRGQFWWGLLLFIPCYGWGLLAVCVPPCVIGTMAGAAFAGSLSKLEPPTVKGTP